MPTMKKAKSTSMKNLSASGGTKKGTEKVKMQPKTKGPKGYK